jgi:hypothetical protein
MLDNQQNVKHNEMDGASHFLPDPQYTKIINLTGFCLFLILACPAILRYQKFK